MVAIDPLFEQQLKIEDKSKSTIFNYLSQRAHFLHFFKEKDIEFLEKAKIRAYNIDLRENMNESTSFQQILISVFNNYYRIVYAKEMDRAALPYPIAGKRLPKVIGLCKKTPNTSFCLIFKTSQASSLMFYAGDSKMI